MKIDLSPIVYIGTLSGSPQSTAQQSPAAGADGTASAVAAKLRPRPRASVAALSSTGHALSVAQGVSGVLFNSDKVAAMQAAIADGSFRINADVIAFKMLFQGTHTRGNGRT